MTFSVRYFTLPLFILLMANYWCVITSLEFKYHKNEDLEDVLEDFVNKTSAPLVSELYSIGKTSAGNQLWVLKISAANQSAIGTPNIKLIGNMHGNEAVSREVLLHFIELLISNYNKDYTITWLLNNTNIHILPSLNPDGFQISSQICNTNVNKGREVPHLKVDLNRNFPSYYHNNSKVRVKDSKETNAIMRWMENNIFILSAALHGGALVANYPFDIRKDVKYEPGPSYTPDNDVFKYLATTYAKNHPKMRLGKPCPDSEAAFEGGIVNGAMWYEFDGSMSDYNYAYHGCMELTLEISCCKYPPETDLPNLWEENREALLQYCMQAHMGVTGQILDFDTGSPITNANLSIVGRNMPFWSSTNTGEFWRILLPGNYKIKVEAVGYHSKIASFIVHDNKSKYPKLTTLRIELQDSSVYTTTEEITTEKMLNQEEITKAITKTYTRVSPKLSNRFGFLKEEGEANIVPLEVKLSGAIKSIIDGILLFNFSIILLLR